MAELIKLYDKVTIPQDVQKDICIKVADHLVKKILEEIINDIDGNVLSCNNEKEEGFR